jgi:hypothetical protein
VLFRLWLNHSFGSGVVYLINLLGMETFWGLEDGVFNTQINVVIWLLFPHDTEDSFSQLKIWQSGAIAVVFFVSCFLVDIWLTSMAYVDDLGIRIQA